MAFPFCLRSLQVSLMMLPMAWVLYKVLINNELEIRVSLVNSKMDFKWHVEDAGENSAPLVATYQRRRSVSWKESF